ncbi:MAG: beta-ketoacyl-[acyl-carrier-protein] synthase family protein [Verrucomicrobia bacterium]|nr:beta-ketoacyl-[acyl-carrier-protein] synthase family protein [Verrucomicrobiota bacterium]
MTHGSSSGHSSQADRRVVITGIGPVTPIGVGLKPFWHGLLAQKSAIKRLARFEVEHCKAKHSAEITDFTPEMYFQPHKLKRLDRYGQFALVSAKLALDDAGLVPNEFTDELSSRAGVIFGTALGGISDAEAEHAKYLERGPKAVDRSLALQIFGGAAHSNIAIEYGFTGVSTTNSNSCASGNVALGEAFRSIRSGHLDLAVVGAAESSIAPLTFSAFDNIATMSRWDGEPAEHACRPFDAQRDGFVMGEGACSFVMEELSAAKRRGAAIYAEVCGFSHNNEAYHMTTPRPGGELVRRVMAEAMREAKVNVHDVAYINPHGSSTKLNDFNEALAICDLFGNHARSLAISGTKAYTGHALGAASALEAACCILAISRGFIPPTLHYSASEPELAALGLDFVPNQGREAKPKVCLNNAFGFGGINSCVALAAID